MLMLAMQREASSTAPREMVCGTRCGEVPNIGTASSKPRDIRCQDLHPACVMRTLTRGKGTTIHCHQERQQTSPC